METQTRRTAADDGPTPKKGNRFGFGGEMAVLVITALVLALLIKTFLFQAFYIPTGSMEPTLHGPGDRVLVNKVPYWLGEPEPGDVVVFKGPDTWTPEVTVAEPGNWFTGSMLWLGRTVGVAPPSEDDYVKRVIAVGGQTVECCDVEGRVTVDGEPLDEPYIFEDTPITQGVTLPIKVLEDVGLRRNDSMLSINVAEGADVDEVHDALDAVVEDLPIVTVQDKEGFADLIKQQVNQLLFMIYGLLALAVIIAVIGIVNTLGLSVIERTREVGLLRAVGLSRRRLRLMITLESIAIAVLGAVLGLAVGLLIGVALRQSLSEDLTVLSLPLGIALGIALSKYLSKLFSADLYTIPFGVNLATPAQGVLVVAVAAVGTALLIRTRVDRLDLVRALKTRE